jgi:hypothetical protein
MPQPQIHIHPSPFVTTSSASAPIGAVGITKTLQQTPAAATKIQIGTPVTK